MKKYAKLIKIMSSFKNNKLLIKTKTKTIILTHK